jgi:hypothetical protein
MVRILRPEPRVVKPRLAVKYDMLITMRRFFILYVSNTDKLLKAAIRFLENARDKLRVVLTRSFTEASE